MSVDEVIYPGELPVDRRMTTWLARRAIMYWSGRGWFDFSGSSRLTALSPNVSALRHLLVECTDAQPGFESFNVDKFDSAWRALVIRGPGNVLSVYSALWAGFVP